MILNSEFNSELNSVAVGFLLSVQFAGNCSSLSPLGSLPFVPPLGGRGSSSPWFSVAAQSWRIPFLKPNRAEQTNTNSASLTKKLHFGVNDRERGPVPPWHWEERWGGMGVLGVLGGGMQRHWEYSGTGR